MADFDALVNPEDKIWTRLLNNFDVVMSDIVTEPEARQAIHDIRAMVDTYGFPRLHKIMSHYLHDIDVDYLYFFARAGVADVVPVLAHFTDSEDVGDVAIAACCLALLRDERGFEIIDALCKNSHRLQLRNGVYWEFSGWIEPIKDERITQIIKTHF